MELLRAAKQVCQQLHDMGHIAYFAGGWVRDHLLGHPSTDIDIATDALPDEIVQIFPDHVLVGKEFGVVLVLYGPYQFEIATFREDVHYTNGRKPAKVNLQRSAEEDAKRRDFTINGMFYDPLQDKIYDFIGGQKDLEHKVIRTIGNPIERFQEDRLRMLRAIRFAHRFNFQLDNTTETAISRLSHTLLPAVSMERIWQELTKMRKAPEFIRALFEMHALGLLGTIFPPLHSISQETLKKRLKGLETLSSRVPTILFLVCLFDRKDLSYIEALAYYLKAAKEDTAWIETFLQIEKTPLRTLSPYKLAKLMANPRFEICFEVFMARQSEKEIKEWQEWYIEQLHRLTFYIHKLRKKEPLVAAKDLTSFGIVPGIEMGNLLEKAWEIAIDNDLKDKELILKELHENHIK